MARASGGGGGGSGGSRFASSNLNDLYGKQASIGPSAGSKTRYMHGGMLVLARPVRTPPGKQVKPAKLSVPAPVNLPSLRKEHAGNDPNITLVGGTGVSGWSKQQVASQQASPLVPEDPALSDGHLKSNGWGMPLQGGGAAAGNVNGGGGGMVDQSPRTSGGKYTPPAARGNAAAPSATVPPSRATGAAAVVLRGEDFPTLQAAAPFNPMPAQHRQREVQQRQRDKQREMKQQQHKLQQLSQNSQMDKEQDDDGGYKPPSPVLALQPQSKQGGSGMRDDSERGYSLKENRKPNGVSLRPGPLLHLSHTSNWADDERETASMSKPPADWEDPPRYGQSPFGRPSFPRDERAGYRNEYGRSREMQDFGWDRDGRHEWGFGRSSGFDRAEGEPRGNSWRLRDNYGHYNRDSFGKESFFNKAGAERGKFGARNGGFDLPGVRSPYTEDAFLRDLPELDMRYRLRRRRDDMNEASYRDLERESFETELERVQKEQEQERQKKIEERERAIELARKEEEERERVAREEEERQRKLEEEAREAAARAEQEALDSVRKVEEAKRVRDEERRRMMEEEERRKENARRKLQELEERIAKREMNKKQPKSGAETSESSLPATKVAEDNDDRTSWRFSGSRVHDSYRRDRDEKWSSNGDHIRSMFSNNFSDLEEDRRWNRRPGDSRPFSPPSPTSYGGGYDTSDGFSFGRLRQSLPKQPRVLPPPTRTHTQKLSFSAAGSAVTPALEVREESAGAPQVADEADNVSAEDSPEDEASTVGDEDVDVSADAEEGDSQPQSESMSAPAKFENEHSETVDEAVEEEQKSDISQEEVLKAAGGALEQDDFTANTEGHEEVTTTEEHMDAADINSNLSEIVDPIVVLPKMEATEVEIVSVAIAEDKAQEVSVKDVPSEAADTSDVPAPLLPSPLHTAELHPAGMQQPFHHPPNFAPPRPRMQGPIPDRGMTIQFGLLPGTSLLQGSIPAIQIGSIQMPLQLHPPIGHHVAHIPPPPQFQFGQISQQSALLPSFTVHPQAMMQPSIMNMDGQQGVPGQHFRMQTHPDRTFWTHQFGQTGQVLQPPVQKNATSEKQAEVAFCGEQPDDGKLRPEPEKQEVVAQEAWKPTHTDGQPSGYNRFLEKTEPRQWPGQAGRQEGYPLESFRKKANRRNSDFRSPIMQERGHYVPRKVGKGDEDMEKSRQAATDLTSSERLLDASGGSEEDDFIEVRSKRQLQKDKQVKSKPKHLKQQAPKQRSGLKPAPSRDSNKNDSLQNSLDAVVTTARTRQAVLSNTEVGFEKRTRSPQPTQINSLVSDAPAFPPIVADTQDAHVNGSATWGFGRSNQEVVALTQIQLEEAMKPARFEVPLPLQVPLSEHLSSALESTPSVTAKDKGARASATSGPVNSLLAGEKIQFGAVTMPAFASTVPWIGPSGSEGFLDSRKELQDDSELASFGKGKRSRENEDGTMDSEAEAEAAEAEAAASAVAVAAISNDDYLHSTDQIAQSHGTIGSTSSNKSSPAGLATQNAAQSSGIDETVNVSLPADLSVDMPLRGPPTSGQHLPSLPGAFPGLEMGTLLGGPVFAFGSGGEGSRESNGERPGLNWQPRRSVDSFYGGPHGFAGPFINHGPIPSIPPHTLVYTSPFGGVGQFGQLGVSYLGPHIPPVKQPDWKHTPTSSGAGGTGGDTGSDGGGGGGGGNGGAGTGMHYAQQSNRHLPHDPSVISVVPPGPFDMYRDMAFQSQWSHVPGPHLPSPAMSGPIPGFPHMHHMRHPHPPYSMQQQADHIGDSYLPSRPSTGAPAEGNDQYLEELGLGDAMSTSSSDANSSFAMQQHQHQQASNAKPLNPVVSSLPAGSKLRSRVVVQPANGTGENNSRPSSGNSSRTGSGVTAAAPVLTFQPHSYVATGPRRSVPHQEKRTDRNVAQHQQGGSKVGASTGWSSHSQQGRKGGGPGGGFTGDNTTGKTSSSLSSSSSPSAAMASKLKQVYVVKPSPAVAAMAAGGNKSGGGGGGGDHGAHTTSEIFSADARHM